jgi:tetratricopeptide (TPR) repeat protein
MALVAEGLGSEALTGEAGANALPILTLAVDRVTFPVAGGGDVANEPSPIVEWQRWNDYGIGLLRKGGKTKGELRQAAEAFERVEALGRPDGPLNLARVYLAEGTVQDQAIEALRRAAEFDPPAPARSVAWFTGQVTKQTGFLDAAIANFTGIVEHDDAETRKRESDFSQDYNLLIELGQTLFERSKKERGPERKERREELMREANGYLDRALVLDPENAEAHYNLSLIARGLGESERAATHLDLYRKYRPDDNARDQAIAIARAADPAANHAAEAIVIYDLHRPEAYELGAAADARRAEEYELRPLPPERAIRTTLEAKGSAQENETAEMPAAGGGR